MNLHILHWSLSSPRRSRCGRTDLSERPKHGVKVQFLKLPPSRENIIWVQSYPIRHRPKERKTYHPLPSRFWIGRAGRCEDLVCSEQILP